MVMLVFVGGIVMFLMLLVVGVLVLVVNITNPSLYESVSSGSGWFWISLLCLFGLFLCYVCLLLEYRGRVLAEARVVELEDGCDVLGWISGDGEFLDEEGVW